MARLEFGWSPYNSSWCENLHPVTLPRIGKLTAGLGYVTEGHRKPRHKRPAPEPVYATNVIGLRPRMYPAFQKRPAKPLPAPPAAIVAVEAPDTPEPVYKALNVQPPRRRVVFATVVAVTEIGALDILSHRRSVPIARARQILAYALRNVTALSLPEIGRFLNRDHTSIIHGVNKVTANPAAFEPELSLVMGRLGALIRSQESNRHV